METVTVAIAGASGFLGSHLGSFLEQHGYTIKRFVRRPAKNLSEIFWDPQNGQIDANALNGVDIVVNLAGENIATGRLTKAKKKRAWDSRVKSTELLVRTMLSLKHKPKLFISQSATGFYGDGGGDELDEDAARGNGFFADLAVAWERAADPLAKSEVRVMHPRTAPVLGRDGGMLKSLIPIYRLGLGAILGSGKQYMSWIEQSDFNRAMLHIIRNPGLTGPINFACPGAITNMEFTHALAKVLHRPVMLKVPATALRLLLGEVSEQLLESSRVVPTKLVASGFQFEYPSLKQALAHNLR
jgi:uncharacterized protein (TIGR01777 family)